MNKKLNKVIALATLVAMSTAVLPTSVMGIDYEGHWAQEAIETWSTNGVLVGFEDGTFRPNDTITRAQLARIITQVFGLSYTKDAKAYTDVKEDAWYADEVAAVSAIGIMNDYEDETFRPNQMATREEAAYAIARAYKIAVEKAEDEETIEKPFIDYAQISDWAEDEVAALVAGGILSGYPDGSFKPQNLLKRSEVVFMFDRITSELIYEEGTYSQDIEGNLVINTADVVLKDMTITGNVYLAEGIGEGDIVLDGVTVLGSLIVQGGGEETVYITGKSSFANIIVHKSGDKPVRLNMGSLTEIKNEVIIQSPSIIEGDGVFLPKVVIKGTSTVVIRGKLTIEDLAIASKVNLRFEDGPIIKKLMIHKEAEGTRIEAKGERASIEWLLNEAKDVALGEGIRVVKITGETVKQETKPGGGGGGSSIGGGGGSGTPSKQAVALQSITLGLVDGTTKEIKISGTIDIQLDQIENTISIEDVDISNLKITSIRFKSNAPSVVLTIDGLESSEIKLQSDEVYKIDEIKKILLNKQQKMMDFINQMEELLADSSVQLESLKTIINNTFGALENKEVIDTDHLMSWFGRVEEWLETNSSYYPHIDTVQKFLPYFSINGLNKDIKNLEVKLSQIKASGSGYETTNHTLNVIYRGK